MSLVQFRPEAYADLAHLVERNLAKVEVAGPSPVIRLRMVVISSIFFRFIGSFAGEGLFKDIFAGIYLRKPLREDISADSF